jgi:hypothetical protein
MRRVAGSGAAVEDYLTGLERLYDSFPVNQTTVSLPHEQFERVRGRRDARIVDAYAEVRNDDNEVLHVENDGAMALPGETVDLSQHIESQVCDAVEEAAGITCSVEGIESATIAGLRDEDAPDRETCYHLILVFEASHLDGTTTEDAYWKAEQKQVGSLSA